MADTSDIRVTQTEWTDLGGGAGASVLIQLRSQGAVIVHASDTEPDVGDMSGIVLSTGNLEEIALNDIGAAGKVYVRARGAAMNISVMTIGV